MTTHTLDSLALAEYKKTYNELSSEEKYNLKKKYHASNYSTSWPEYRKLTFSPLHAAPYEKENEK